MRIVVNILAALAMGSLIGCTDIFPSDISKKTVELFAPGDRVEVKPGEVIFSWNPVDGATAYEILLVRPSFDDPKLLLMDSTVSIARFSVTMSADSCQWCVRASNGAYKTGYTCRSIVVKD